MTDQPSNGAAPAAKKPRQGRSPAFPFIPLQKALERTEAFRIAEGGRPKHFAPLASACKTWGMGPKTGPAIQTVAALNHYGLVDFEGAGETRAMRPSDVALQILLDKQPVSPERDKLIQRVALTPPIHKELWDKWGEALPSDPTFETYLVRDRGFSDGGAKDLMAEYKATIAFAKLKEGVTVAPADGPDAGGSGKEKLPPVPVAVGDLVTVEVGGVLVFAEPKRVRAIQDGWVFLDDVESGVEMENVEIVEKAADKPADQKVPPRLPLPEKVKEQDVEEPGARVARFVLKEGDVKITFPDVLSADSVEDLDGYLEVFLKKARREAGMEPKKKAN